MGHLTGECQDPSVELLIGEEDGEHIRGAFGDIAVPGRIVVQVNLVVSPFSCTFETWWESRAIPKFRSDLERAYEDLDAEFSFFPDLDGTLELKFRGDGLGHFDVTGEACPNGGWQSPWLRFELLRLFDQTYLPPMIGTLLELEAQYPSE